MSRPEPLVPRLLRLGLVAGQLAFAVAAIWLFAVESPAFLQVSVLVLVGFVVHALLPRSWRLTFFLALSIAASTVVLGFQNAGWLFGLGLLLIGICHLPIAFAARAALLIAAGLGLALLRAGFGSPPWSHAIWPILGAMFMFRLIIYMYDLRHEPAVPWRWTLSYFFMLPTVCFPLFPVVDFRKFRTDYYNEPSHLIYQRGVRWIVTGVTHILAYRFVYQHLAYSADEVDSLGSLALYIVSSFLLYLRVSGNFHMIVGMLLLFGFNLPRTNLYYMAPTSFTDFWRRANIYWKDFMMKVFYHPVYFRLKKRGATTALVVATSVVFATTAVLHSYQWFWLLGAPLSRWEEVLFWTLFFVLVLTNVLLERGRRGRSRSRLVTNLYRVGTTSFIFLLWSMWTSDSLEVWLGLWSAAGRWSWLLAAVPVVFFLAGLVCERLQMRRQTKPQRRVEAGEEDLPFGSSVARVVATLGLVLALGSPFLVGLLGSRAAEALSSVWVSELNRRDEELLERGYYEHLTGSPWQNPELLALYARRPGDWRSIWETEVWRETNDFVMGELVPSSEVTLRGSRLSTNRWGMRDQDYAQEKTPGTFRFALLGGSHTMGAGVGDGETFETLLEQRLNSEATSRATSFEILNFAVGGRFTIRQVPIVEDQIFAFSPDAAILSVHRNDPGRALRDLQRMVNRGIDIPYGELRAIISEAGVTREMPEVVVTRLLRPYELELIGWAYDRIAAACRAQGVVPIWLFLPNSSGPETDEEYRRLAELADSAGFVLVDISDAFEGHAEEELRVAPWDGHPNALAHRLMADELFDVLISEGGLDAVMARRAAVPPGEPAASAGE